MATFKLSLLNTKMPLRVTSAILYRRVALAVALIGTLGASTATATQLVHGPCLSPTKDCPTVSSLLTLRQGYGGKATGGLGGTFVQVTSSLDSGPGTLRTALQDAVSGPVWITFSADMTIPQTSQYKIPSNVTVDGRGYRVTLLDYGLGVYKVHNVIVTHMTIDGESKTFSQAFNVSNFSHDIWGDHLDLARFNDRLIDVKDGATDVTLSWIKFHDDNKVMLLNNLTQKNLFANYDRDANNRVTLHHCYFLHTVQRNPRAQIGIFHIYNNLLEDWDFYGMSFSLEARATVEGNVFINNASRPCLEPSTFQTVEGKDATYCRGIPAAPSKAILDNGASDEKNYQASNPIYHYAHDWRAYLKIRDNLFMGDATVGNFADYHADLVPRPPYCYAYDQPGEGLAGRIRREAGNTAFEGDPPPARC